MEKYWKISRNDELRKHGGKLNHEDIKLIQDWLETQPHLPEIDEIEIIVMLHSSDYDVDKAKLLIDQHFTSRTKMTSMFTNRDPNSKQIVDNSNLSVEMFTFPDLDDDGNLVFYGAFKTPDASVYDFIAVCKTVMMGLDVETKVRGTVAGLVVVVDMQNFTFSHILKVTYHFSTLRDFMGYMHDGMLYKIVAIHYLNCGYIIEKLVGLLKSVTKESLMQKMVFHKESYPIEKCINPKILPVELGGNAGSKESLERRFRTLLIDYKGYFEDDEKLRRVNEKCRPRKKHGYFFF